MSDRMWAVFMVIVTNLITIGVSLFSNRARKLDKEIEKITEEIKDIPIIKKDLELFRQECKERHNNLKKIKN